MTKIEFWERILLFLKNIPKILKETIVWFCISYIIPVVNIGIIYGLKREKFEIDLPIISIIIATNACFYASLYYLAFRNKKKRNLINAINIALSFVTVATFSVATIELANHQPLFQLWFYKTLTYVSFLGAIILALISKYDEIQALSQERAKEARQTKDTQIEGKNVEI